MNEPDDDKLRQLLKKSPALTPPESFYREILRKIEPESPEPVRWYQRFPVQALATACVLMVIVLAVREKSPELTFLAGTRMMSLDKGNRQDFKKVESLKNMTMREKEAAPLEKQLAESEGVQTRLNKSISGMVKSPSPFEEEDEKLRQEIKADQRPVEKAGGGTFAAAKSKSVSLGYTEQARDTVGGSATQNSFLYSKSAYGLKKRESAFGEPVGQSSLRAKPEYPASSHAIVAQNSLNGTATNAGSFQYESGAAEDWRGSSSGIERFTTLTARTAAEWQALWKNHTSNMVPASPAPEVDFSRSLVVGVFSGTKSSGGYSVEILNVRTMPDKVIVQYRETMPPPGTMNTQALTQPYHLRVIPKSPLPVVFEKLR